MDAGIGFVACDNPYANKMTIHILAAIAEHEREIISRRTREALATAKAKAIKLGGYRGTTVTDKIRQDALLARRAKSKEYSPNVIAMIQEHLGSGHSLNATARILNQQSIVRGIGGHTLRSLQHSRFIYNLDPQKVDVLGSPTTFLQRINEEHREVCWLSVQYAGVDLIKGLAVQTL
jgi:hypothetical protein